MSARRDRAAVEARRQRALERLRASQPVPTKKQPKAAVPDTAAGMLAFAASLGWSWERRRDGYRFHHPSGATAMMHLTISDFRAWRNLRAEFLRGARRAG